MQTQSPHASKPRGSLLLNPSRRPPSLATRRQMNLPRNRNLDSPHNQSRLRPRAIVNQQMRLQSPSPDSLPCQSKPRPRATVETQSMMLPLPHPQHNRPTRQQDESLHPCSSTRRNDPVNLSTMPLLIRQTTRPMWSRASTGHHGTIPVSRWLLRILLSAQVLVCSARSSVDGTDQTRTAAAVSILSACLTWRLSRVPKVKAATLPAFRPVPLRMARH